MGHDCCPAPKPPTDVSYRRVLWIALVANVLMFLVEVVAAAWSGSSALAADAADFLGDSANYALSLGALALGGAWISRVALLKGVAMSLYGIGVLAYAAWRACCSCCPCCSWPPAAHRPRESLLKGRSSPTSSSSRTARKR